MFCENCKKQLSKRWQKKFCSLACQMRSRRNAYISEWKNGKASGSIGINVRALSAHVKSYIIETHGSGCMLCGWHKKNPVTGRIPLEIDHIDGDSENNSITNLRLICPNCHSLTPNFKNLNKGRGRKWRMKKYVKNSG